MSKVTIKGIELFQKPKPDILNGLWVFKAYACKLKHMFHIFSLIHFPNTFIEI